jgi:Fe-Mn family superoxide dismutase
MAIHHDKHHRTYVDNLNKALEGYEDLQAEPTIELLRNLGAIPKNIRTAVRNNGGGHVNHTMFWHTMSPKGGGEPGGGLAEAIQVAFGSFDSFKRQFSQAAASQFGSGWAWLCVDYEGELTVTTTPGHDSPIYEGLIPILVLDVWEHAYYLKYENRRPDYIAAWWDVVSWDQVAGNYAAVKVGLGLDRVAQWAKITWDQVGEGWSKLTQS